VAKNNLTEPRRDFAIIVIAAAWGNNAWTGKATPSDWRNQMTTSLEGAEKAERRRRKKVYRQTRTP
jgi:hypothetical protein